MNKDENQLPTDESMVFPVIPLRNLVLFPGMRIQFDIARKKSIAALNQAMQSDKLVFFLTQKNAKMESPKTTDLYKTGVVARIDKISPQKDDTFRVFVEGGLRAKVTSFVSRNPYLSASVEKCEETSDDAEYENKARLRMAKDLFFKYLDFSAHVPPDIVFDIDDSGDVGVVADGIAANISFECKKKQELLEELNASRRLEKMIDILFTEVNVLEFMEGMDSKLQKRLDKNQKEYYMREQMKLISEELGEADNPQTEAEEFKEKILKLKLADDVSAPLIKECERLSKMPFGSHEANVVRNYLDACLSLPWNKKTTENIQLDKAQKILDKEHFGLTKVKECIIELLAVRKLSPDIKGQIICLVGPPGVGKTSVARSIAKAIGRKYARVALGGIRDESEIRGHRRTYIGAMPGRIISAVKSTNTKNPLILLDEIDKLCHDFQGDPTSALLEVLDSEQNSTFHDHYIDLPFDLSEVLFITTANDYDAIPDPLRDRMEVISLPSYTHEEKFHIAKKHLLPKQMKKYGITAKMVKVTDQAIHKVVSAYTREAGVRTLERTLASLLRKSAKKIIENQAEKISVNLQNLEEFLGPEKFKKDTINETDEIGVSKGLAWTSVGGETMPIEVALMPGSGKLELTGSLGDVMKESAQIAISCLRSHSDFLDIRSDFYSVYDIHIHVPDGAIPKDGPSAGTAMATALVSALKKIPVRRDVAMTGEITLRGRVLPIGGLKEKTMAAYRAGIKTVIIPQDNEPDLAEIDPVVKENIEFVPVDRFNKVLERALCAPSSKFEAKKSPFVINSLETDFSRAAPCLS